VISIPAAAAVSGLAKIASLSSDGVLRIKKLTLF
jgi:hypothetical protein